MGGGRGAAVSRPAACAALKCESVAEHTWRMGGGRGAAVTRPAACAALKCGAELNIPGGWEEGGEQQ
jgi:hypothetical protein